MDQKADIMIIAAHPDDPEFGIAGTIAKWTKSGKVVVYVICTNGDKGTIDPEITAETLTKIRQEEQKSAAKILGVSQVIFLGYPDQGLEETSEFRREIVRQIRVFRPDIVATSDPYRKYLLHRDHRIAGQVVLDAVYPFARDHLAYPDLIAQGYQPHKVKEVLTWGTDDPNYWSDITETFPLKSSAIRCHRSQIGNRDASEMLAWLKERAIKAAKGKDFELAEEFHRTEIWM
jgi:LmbE family N-acetylglucosaminyl deacetylase